MSSSKYARTKLSKMNKRTDVESIRFELYSILTHVVLSKEFYQHNKEISEFTEGANIIFKEYVFDSRTLLLARLLREVEKASNEKIFLIMEQLQNKFFDKNDRIAHNKSHNKNNTIDSLLNYFPRGENN